MVVRVVDEGGTVTSVVFVMDARHQSEGFTAQYYTGAISRNRCLPPERVLALDVLCGWAVFGMLIVNLGYFFQLSLDPGGGFDAVGVPLVWVLADDKFWALFSVLFGVGVALQMNRANVFGRSFTGRCVRRLVVLLIIGLAHVLLHPAEVLDR